MTPKELATSIEQTIDKAQKVFTDGVKSSQRNASTRIVSELKKLETKDGNILSTRKNLKRLKNINRLINRSLLTRQYKNRVARYLGQFEKILGLNRKYFAGFDGFRDNTESLTNLTRLSMEQAAEALGRTAVTTEFTRPVQEIVTKSITTRASFNDLVDEVRLFIEGNPQRLGAWVRYTKQITHDALFTYARAYQENVAEDLGLVYYRYIGGIIQDSRPFCTKRNGKYFHKSEVQSWGNIQEWQGRASGTNESSIFYLLGGYNCRHTLVPVLEAVVPKKDRI